MILLDTDHLTILAFSTSEQHARLQSRMAASRDQDFATTIVNAEEQMRGWLAEINRLRTVHQQISAYEHLRELLNFLGQLSLIPLDALAAEAFERLRRARIRIGGADLKIASIALVHQVLLLSENLRDFQRVPGLRVENWLQK